MTTQIDDTFVEWLTRCFTLEALQDMSDEQQKVMRDAYISGVLAGLGIQIPVLSVELKQFMEDCKRPAIQFEKARHCWTEALIIKKAEN